jgi:pyruvate-formate lyase-activating enzyme
VLRGARSELCPGGISADQVLFSGQGLGPARNLVTFTGGDLCCRPEYYAAAASAIRAASPKLHVLVETSGVALDRRALEVMREGGVEAFWLDIKAHDDAVHRQLTGFHNRHVLAAPALMRELGFTVEVLTLYIPGLVETDQIARIAEGVAEVDPAIPFTLLAFFPAYRLEGARAPSFEEMMGAGRAVLAAGVRELRLGNLGVFCDDEQQMAAASQLGQRAP